MQAAVDAYQAGRLDEAARFCELMLAADPRNIDAINIRGALHMRRGEREAALALFTRAVEVQPDFAEAHNNRGVVLQELKRWDEALRSYERALQLSPDYVDALYNRGVVLGELKRWEDALQSYERVIALQRDHPRAHNNRGNVLHQLKRWDEAAQSYRRALQLRPDHPEALNNLGVVLKDLRRWDEALQSYERALAVRPDYAEALNNRGVALKEVKRWDEALQSLGRAVALRPEYAEAFNNRGMVFQELRRWDPAFADYQHAADLRADYAEPRWNTALLSLLHGDYARGWELFEWRWRTEAIGPQAREFSQPLWLGREDVSGKTILLHAEQGLGDTIFFARYVPLVESLGAKVVFEVPAALANLMSASFPSVRIITKQTTPPECDFQCPLASLPRAFKTTLDSIPAPREYLRVDAGSQETWRRRLGDKTRLRVGIAWAGSAAHRNDRDRSIDLARLRPWFDLDIEFHSLQKETRPGDEKVFAQVALKRWDAELRDFADTAALIQALDLVVSVDTSTAHLAAALGKPTWILLPHSPDYRWLLDRSDSPWYPTARLIRQPRSGDWDTVIAGVRAELEKKAGSRLPAS
jgi:tetratricopeptide (TPR) repeat protein